MHVLDNKKTLNNLEELFKNESENCIICKNEERQFMKISLEGKLDYGEYKAAFEKFLELVCESGYTKLLYDVKNLTSTDPRARAWYLTKHLPTAFKSIDPDKKLKCALVKPSSTFQKFLLDAVVKGSQKRGRDLEVEFFSELDDAMAWI